ncbi:MAG: K+/H+ antiporter subunit F [Brachymonas sp.]|nr:K+/H+ antiporter subunit F [Brachymonas sp.]
MTPFLTSSWLQLALTFALVCYGLASLPALWLLIRGPAAQDRVLALDFMYVLGMLTALTLGIRNGSAMYFEAALLIALTSFVSSAAMGKFLLRGEVIE